MTFRFHYIAIAATLFLVEVAIALGVVTGVFVRESLGDVLVIALIYFSIRGVTRLSPSSALTLGLLAGLAAELLQYIHLADRLGLRKGSLFYILIGNTFSPLDLAMYFLGGILAAGLDALRIQKARSPG